MRAAGAGFETICKPSTRDDLPLRDLIFESLPLQHEAVNRDTIGTRQELAELLHRSPLHDETHGGPVILDQIPRGKRLGPIDTGDRWEHQRQLRTVRAAERCGPCIASLEELDDPSLAGDELAQQVFGGVAIPATEKPFQIGDRF
jgi:hypothetical protein